VLNVFDAVAYNEVAGEHSLLCGVALSFELISHVKLFFHLKDTAPSCL
jgi:hypothetical protein